MTLIAMVFPIPPEKLDLWRAGVESFGGERRAEYEAARARQGVLRQGVFLQQGPGGPLEILVMETEDPERMFREMATSTEPFDVEFREFVQEVYGMDLAGPLPPSPEQVLDVDLTGRRVGSAG
jgi:hypothetical protein